MRYPLYRIVASLLIFGCGITSTAQQNVPLSKRAESVKRKASTLTLHAHISVIPVASEEEFGDFIASDPEGFTFHDVDRKVDVTLRYEEVRKIKDGYGGYNHLRKRHTDRTKALVAGLVVVGLIAALIGMAAASK